MPKTALVTGASSGIGAEFARQLAARGDNVVLVARTVTALETLAQQLREHHRVEVDVIAQDLAAAGGTQRVVDELRRRDLRIDLLVNNAGFGTAGRFESIPPDREHDEVMVNIVAMVDLTHAVLPDMVRRGVGGVINIGSTAGFLPLPFFTTYSASKAFVLQFSLGLWAELRGRGVNVLAVTPGPVNTSFFDKVGSPDAAMGPTITPEKVVRAALRGLERNRGYLTPGAGNFAMTHLMPRRPRKLMTLATRTLTRALAETDKSSEAALTQG